MSTVSIVKVEREEGELKGKVFEAVKRSMELSDWRRHIHRGKDLFIKFSMPWCDFLLPGMCTTPWALEAVVEVVQNHVADIYLIEGIAAAKQSFRKGCRINQYDRVAERYGKMRLRNVGLEPMVEVKVPEARLSSIRLPKSVLEVGNYISVSPMKTHSVTGFTGALKNQFGVSHHKRILYHICLDEVIATINREIKPNFAVIDGTVSLEGQGPANGESIERDLILSSPDLVAVDAVACRTMGINPEKIGHITTSQRRGVGNMKAEVVGERAEDHVHRFKPATPQGYAELMFWVRRQPVLGNFVFNYLWNLGTYAVKVYRDLWYIYKGRPDVREFLERSSYREWQ